jgi:hypothetical protein
LNVGEILGFKGEKIEWNSTNNGQRTSPLLSDEDAGLETLAALNCVKDRERPLLEILRAQVVLNTRPDAHFIRMVHVIIVLRVHDHASLVRLQVRDNVAPALAVVDANSKKERLFIIGLEAQGARRIAAVAEVNNVLFGIRGPADCILPRRLFDNAEEVVTAGLVNTESDGVAHSVQIHNIS